jgi:2',3'-cyclic-nucleotide 2'-phosphodiesterase (5'-nucleotidase family)
MACRFFVQLSSAVFAALLTTSAGFAAAPQDDLVHFVVLHTNDVHGQVLPRKATWLKRPDPPLVGGLARVAARVHFEKTEAESEGARVLVVDGGDWYQGTPEGVVDDGLPFLLALAGVGYDAVCVGNHEFDFGVPNLVKLIRESKLPAVVANLTERETKQPIAWAPPWRIVQKGDWKIAIVGLLTPETPDITHPDAKTLMFEDPATALTRVASELTGKVDWILPITHLGVEDDRALAKAHPDLPLIVGGHSHTFLKSGVRTGNTLIVQTGSKASSLGRVDIWFDAHSKVAVKSKARLIDLDAEPAAADCIAAVEASCAALVKRSNERMNEVVGALSAPLERAKEPLSSSTAGNFLADALRAHTLADVGLMNRGGIRADLDAGPITRRQVFELCPFENNVTVLTLTGAELTAMLTKSVEGTAHSGLEVSGLVVEAAVDAGGQRTLRGLKVGGEPLDTKREYRVALNSFLADGGDAYIEKFEPGPKRKDDLLLMRDLVEETFRNQKKVVPNAENRYAVTRAP